MEPPRAGPPPGQPPSGRVCDPTLDGIRRIGINRPANLGEPDFSWPGEACRRIHTSSLCPEPREARRSACLPRFPAGSEPARSGRRNTLVSYRNHTEHQSSMLFRHVLYRKRLICYMASCGISCRSLASALEPPQDGNMYGSVMCSVWEGCVSSMGSILATNRMLCSNTKSS